MRSYTLQFARSERIGFDVFISCLRKQLILFGECIWKYLTSIWLKVFPREFGVCKFLPYKSLQTVERTGRLEWLRFEGNFADNLIFSEFEPLV